jgi:tetratricopeptide (TPR) repeat protein
MITQLESARFHPSSLIPHPCFIVLAALLILMAASAPDAHAQRRKRGAAASVSTKSLTIRTEPEAIVWLDEVRRGVADASGRLTLTNVSAGRHTLRVRANGFKEYTTLLPPARRGEIAAKLTRTTDEAELTFQQAETAREKARDEESRKAAEELYRRALKLRPGFPAARVGLARLLLDLNDYKGALEQIDEARAVRPLYPEASAVEGRILRENADPQGAIEAFQRAIREARGFQPEAHTGLALALEDKGRDEEAAAEFRKAIAQLSDPEPVIYQLLGALYEKMEKYKEAVAAYEKFLQLAPDSNLAPAVRSVLDQLRRQAAEQEASEN